MESKNKDIGPYVDRIETTPDMVWPSNEGRLNKIEDTVFNKVTFVDGDVTLFTQNVADNETVERPEEEPIKDGYIFDDWYADSAFTNAYDFSTPVVNDITIYAKFIALNTVTFVDGENVLLTENVAMNDVATRPAADPTKEGFVFDNWYADSELTTTYDFTTPVTSDLTIYAKFTEE